MTFLLVTGPNIFVAAASSQGLQATAEWYRSAHL